MESAELTIGQLAGRVGINTSAIRYYEREGVLPQPERVSGQRRYGPDAVRRLEILGVAKQAGFTLDDVRVLLESIDAGEPAHEPLQRLATRKLPDVEALIAQATAIRTWLTTATSCGCDTLDACALFDGDGPVAERASPSQITHVPAITR